MKILALHASFWHDPSAAVSVDGELVAAIEEERLSRRKHAPHATPIASARACLQLAGLEPSDLDLVVYTWSPRELAEQWWRYRRRQGKRAWRRPWRNFTEDRRLARRRTARLSEIRRELGIPDAIPTESFPHHECHAASSFLISGFDEAAILSIDGQSDRVASLAARGRGLGFEVRHQSVVPDSLGLFYSSFTDFLGFDINDGEYKTMGMAAYGDRTKFDLSRDLRLTADDVRLEATDLAVPRGQQWRHRSFGPGLVERFGPPRAGDALASPYPDLAAAVQGRFEEAAFHLIDRHLKDELERHGRLCLAGGCALNVVLNRRLIERPDVGELFVPPAPHDPGTTIGAIALALARRGERLAARPSPYLGPRPGDATRALDRRGIPATALEDPAVTAAALLAEGHVVAWCQGRMEWGPRSLGARSILGHPGRKGTSDDINRRIKFRETWRPFCPSVLAERRDEVYVEDHDSPYMTYSFRATDDARRLMPEIVHVDGTLRPQTVRAPDAPEFHRLLTEFARRTGLPAVINTSLNRRGEPVVCTADDALDMFFGSGLEYLVLEDRLVVKDQRALEPLSPLLGGV